jgi:prepilin-type processing-associated H-X9-DG protein
MTEQSRPQKPSWWDVGHPLGLVLAVCLVIGACWLFLPRVGGPREASRRTQCKNNLKQLALALHNYHDFYGCFPPAYIADKQGRPMHSWRTLLLPFCEFKPIYQEYRFDEPWNSPHNRKLAALPLNLFQCPETKHSNSETNYLVVVGPRTVFPGSKCVKISEITAGTPETVLIVEVDNSGIQWAEPRDLSEVEAARGINPTSGIGISSRHKTDGAQIAFADGSVRFLPSDYPPGNLPALFDRDAKPKPRLPDN